MLKNRGFSLIEVIISLTILAVIGLIISMVVNRTYKSTSDSDLLSNLRQNGQRASNIISKAIRDSEAVVCYSSIYGQGNDVIVIRTLGGKYNKFRFHPPTTLPGQPPSSNGTLTLEENLNPANPQTLCSRGSITQDFLTDADPINGVSITKGSFTKIAGTTGKHTVTIKFDVESAVKYVGSKGTVPVQTTVQVRN